MLVRIMVGGMLVKHLPMQTTMANGMSLESQRKFSAYIQNVFEVPWMVINYGIRVDGALQYTGLGRHFRSI